MRVLVTGATGFVGGAIARRLLQAGDSVVGLGRSPAPPGAAFTSIQVDIGATDAVGRIESEVGRCDAIIHAAASLEHNPEAASVIDVNCRGTQRMLTIARRWRVSSFVYTSSIGVIGEPTDPPVREDHPTHPVSAYHASKLFGEALVHVAAREGMRAAALRLTSPVGAGMPRNRIFPVFVERALAGQSLQVAGRGSRRQDYVDVEDVAAAAELCLRVEAIGVYNVGSGASVSNAELARACVETIGSSSSVELGHGDDREEGVRWDISIELATAELGYRPQVDLAASIRAVAGESASSRSR